MHQKCILAGLVGPHLLHPTGSRQQTAVVQGEKAPRPFHGYRRHRVEHAATLGTDVWTVRRDHGFLAAPHHPTEVLRAKVAGAPAAHAPPPREARLPRRTSSRIIAKARLSYCCRPHGNDRSRERLFRCPAGAQGRSVAPPRVPLPVQHAPPIRHPPAHHDLRRIPPHTRPALANPSAGRTREHPSRAGPAPHRPKVHRTPVTPTATPHPATTATRPHPPRDGPASRRPPTTPCLPPDSCG